MRIFAKSLCLALLFVAASSETLARTNGASFRSSAFLPRNVVGGELSLDVILAMRGGAGKKKPKVASLTKSSKTVTGKKKVGDKLKAQKPDSVKDQVFGMFSRVQPVTRVYLCIILTCTLLGLLLGEERGMAFMALDPMRTLYGGELWRPITAASNLGKPSIGWLMSVFYLVQYGNTLERAYGPAQFFIFLMSQLGLLSLLSMLFRMPSFANAVVTAMLHVLSRATPKQKVKWLILDIPYFALPYGVMLVDCLQAQSAAAAVPHVLGILSGHFYLFHRFIWPKIGGEDWLSAPDFLIERMDPNAAKKSAAKESLSKALKSRKRGKGKRLGR